MSGDFPSGESLKTAEGPFVGKGTGKQRDIGGEMTNMMSFALQVDGSPEGSVVTPIWKAFESRSETEALNQAAMKKTLGIPDDQIWAELGYSQDEIAEFTAKAEAKRQQQMEQFSQSFDRGAVPIGG